MRFHTIFDKFGGVPGVPVTDKSEQQVLADKEAGVITTEHPVDSDSETLSPEAQAGVQKIEAITSVWSKSHLIAAYVMIWIILFVDSMQQSMGFSFSPYVTSTFSLHSLTATTGVVSGIVGGLIKLPLAKILDIWGRPQGFLLMDGFLIIGMIMMAACKNVETYAAAQVFYWVGYNGISYTLSIFIADTSHLKNRAFMFGVASSPYIITTWIGGPMAQSFLKGIGWRWGYGIFAIVTLVVTLPLFALFQYNYMKAKRANLIPERISNRTIPQSIKYYAIEFDILGVFILCAGLSLFLLPFNLYAKQSEGWKSPMIIGMIVAGVILCILFALYERFLAPVTFMPYKLLTDRTVLGACILSGVLFISFYIWDSFFGSFLQVVSELNVTEASYVMNTYSIGSCFWALVVGVLIRWTGRFKWLALYFGVPLTILGVALMIHFRQPGEGIGYIIMCQIFIAVAGGTLVICEQIAAMAATTHQYIAVVIAIEGMFASVGGAIGQTVAGAIWQGIFPKKLMEYLPEESQGDFAQIYGNIVVQLSYPPGTPTRLAIQRAYGEAQKYMLIGGSTVLVAAVISVLMWRDIRVKDFKQVKGRVV